MTRKITILQSYVISEFVGIIANATQEHVCLFGYKVVIALDRLVCPY